VHFTGADLEADRAGGTGVAVVERLGAVSTQLLTDWLARHAEAG
jgi:hypothetical protein